MEKKKKLDLIICLLCALIIFLAAYGIGDAETGMAIVLLASVGFAVFLYSFLAAAAKQRALREPALADEGSAATELLLLNEEDKAVASWEIFGRTSLVIGKDIKENHVDINLSQSPYASLIDIEHAVMNYADHHWYIEDLSSANGLVLKKVVDGRKYKLSADQPCRLDLGDVIIIGLTKLQLR